MVEILIPVNPIELPTFSGVPIRTANFIGKANEKELGALSVTAKVAGACTHVHMNRLMLQLFNITSGSLPAISGSTEYNSLFGFWSAIKDVA